MSLGWGYALRHPNPRMRMKGRVAMSEFFGGLQTPISYIEGIQSLKARCDKCPDRPRCIENGSSVRVEGKRYFCTLVTEADLL